MSHRSQLDFSGSKCYFCGSLVGCLDDHQLHFDYHSGVLPEIVQCLVVLKPSSKKCLRCFPSELDFHHHLQNDHQFDLSLKTRGKPWPHRKLPQLLSQEVLSDSSGDPSRGSDGGGGDKPIGGDGNGNNSSTISGGGGGGREHPSSGGDGNGNNSSTIGGGGGGHLKRKLKEEVKAEVKEDDDIIFIGKLKRGKSSLKKEVKKEEDEVIFTGLRNSVAGSGGAVSGQVLGAGANAPSAGSAGGSSGGGASASASA